jgi:N-acetylneuraminate synthase
VKFQTFKADRLVTAAAPKARYQTETTDAAESQLDMLRRLELTDDAHRALVRACASLGLVFLSTPFDEESADFLDGLGMAAFKIPSGEVTNLPFLTHVARKGKPMIVSTGMAALGEVEAAVRTIEATGNRDIVLLHCVSDYPAGAADANLRAMATMQAAFGVPVGYSDHTMGLPVAHAAVALGACLLEKHFTLDCSLPGPDHRASLEPNELKALIQGVRTVESALGHGRKTPTAREASTAAVARKSLVAARELRAGTVLTEALIAIKRPGTGLAPAMLGTLVGRTLREDVAADVVLTFEMLA